MQMRDAKCLCQSGSNNTSAFTFISRVDDAAELIKMSMVCRRHHYIILAGES
jgi:hypothetical protein